MNPGLGFWKGLGLVGVVVGVDFGGGRGFVFGRLKRASEGALEAFGKSRRGQFGKLCICWSLF